MVEFLLVVWHDAAIGVRQLEIYSRYHRLLTLILRHETVFGSG
jgi:hypothetical protein